MSQLVIQDELKRSGIDQAMKGNVQVAIERVLNTPLGKEFDDLRLNQLTDTRRINELKFDLSMSLQGPPVNAIDIAQIFNKTPKDRFGRDYIESLKELNISSKGFLTGSIDLVFTDSDNIENSKWWVVDWKSNWL